MRNKTNLIKVVIAGGMPILKCILSVFKELNYTIKKYKTKNENIQILQNIRPETAIKIEQSNYESDIWQTLFFDKKSNISANLKQDFVPFFNIQWCKNKTISSVGP